MDLLHRLQAWYDDSLPELQAEGYIVEFSEPVPKHSKSSASVMVSSTSRIGKLTVWTTGEAELDLGDVESREVTGEHLEINGGPGLADVTRALVAWVRGM